MSPAIKLSMKLPGLFKSQKFAYFIDDKMKLKSKEPSQTGFSSAGKTFKDFISGDSNCFYKRLSDKSQSSWCLLFGLYRT